MTIDEAIKEAEENAERHDRGVLLPFIDPHGYLALLRFVQAWDGRILSEIEQARAAVDEALK